MIQTFKKGDTVRLSPNFVSTEFDCKCGAYCNETKIDLDMVTKLQLVRDYFGCALIPTSGFRCPTHNQNVGGGKASYHMKGMACDFIIPGHSPSEVAKVCESVGFKGIGCYIKRDFVHVDNRDDKYFWIDYDSNSTDTFGGVPGSFTTVVDPCDKAIADIISVLKNYHFI